MSSFPAAAAAASTPLYSFLRAKPSHSVESTHSLKPLGWTEWTSAMVQAHQTQSAKLDSLLVELMALKQELSNQAHQNSGREEEERVDRLKFSESQGRNPTHFMLGNTLFWDTDWLTGSRLGWSFFQTPFAHFSKPLWTPVRCLRVQHMRAGDMSSWFSASHTSTQPKSTRNKCAPRSRTLNWTWPTSFKSP